MEIAVQLHIHPHLESPAHITHIDLLAISKDISCCFSFTNGNKFCYLSYTNGHKNTFFRP